MIPKPIDDIAKSDIDLLINNGVAEGRAIEPADGPDAGGWGNG